nr:MAG TPA: hypothetical protein [Caudoviricetes sp.]
MIVDVITDTTGGTIQSHTKTTIFLHLSSPILSDSHFICSFTNQ